MKKIAIAALFVTISAQALPPPLFRNGDVIVASAEPACVIDPPPPASDVVVLHGRDAAPIRDLTSKVIGTARYLTGGLIYVVSQQSIDTIMTDGTLVPVFALSPGSRATALAVAGENVLVIVYTGADPHLLRHTALTNPVDVATLPRYEHYISAADVAADRCTMFYAADDRIERFDVCAKRSLSTFARTAASDLRVLPDGGLLVASGSDLVRFDAAGNLVARFPITAGNEWIGAIALDTNPSLAWVVTTFGCLTGPSRVMQVSLATGAITAGPQRASRSGGFAIAVQGEWRAGVDAPTPRRRAVR